MSTGRPRHWGRPRSSILRATYASQRLSWRRRGHERPGTRGRVAWDVLPRGGRRESGASRKGEAQRAVVVLVQPHESIRGCPWNDHGGSSCHAEHASPAKDGGDPECTDSSDVRSQRQRAAHEGGRHEQEACHCEAVPGLRDGSGACNRVGQRRVIAKGKR